MAICDRLCVGIARNYSGLREVMQFGVRLATRYDVRRISGQNVGACCVHKITGSYARRFLRAMAVNANAVENHALSFWRWITFWGADQRPERHYRRVRLLQELFIQDFLAHFAYSATTATVQLVGMATVPMHSRWKRTA